MLVGEKCQTPPETEKNQTVYFSLTQTVVLWVNIDLKLSVKLVGGKLKILKGGHVV